MSLKLRKETKAVYCDLGVIITQLKVEAINVKRLSRAE